MSDQLGARVICYYDEDVDKIADALRAGLEVDESRSVDKRTDLRSREFGYKSVHLVARITPSDARNPQYVLLRGQCFEIQVRSILEHTWAEIEHEIRYKSGIKFRGDVSASTCAGRSA
jgi:ppGpp synthetase/RelA/SpoT-type nucleotidyltranferase